MRRHLSIRTPVAILLVNLMALASFAQSDDDAPLAPLVKPKPKAAPKPKPKPRPVPRAPANNPPDELVPLVAGTGELTIVGTEDATVFVDQKEVGKLPLAAPLKLSSGAHTLLVKKLGFSSAVKQLSIGSKSKTEFKAQLDAVSTVLSIRSDIKGAQVFVGKRLVGSAPVIDLETDPGAISVIVKTAGKPDFVKSLDAKAGKAYEVLAEFNTRAVEPPRVAAYDRPLASQAANDLDSDTQALTDSPRPIQDKNSSITSKWYFWAGIGAVVIAAASVVTAVGVSDYNACLDTPGGKIAPLPRDGATQVGIFASTPTPTSACRFLGGRTARP